jgi:HAD superfamily hydrolase (TIGR01509 family)
MATSAIIFDVDGTLVDDNEAHVEAWHQAFTAHGFNVPRERIAPEVGKGGDQLVPSILGEEDNRQKGKAVRESHDQIFMEMARRRTFRLFDGTQALLIACQRRGLRVAVATSSKREFLQATLDSAGLALAPFADTVVTADDADRSKPAPDLVLATLDKLAVPAGRCVMVGDTPHDAAACRKAGVRFVGVTCGGNSERTLREAGAAAVYRDPADLLAHLDQVVAG